MIGVGLWNLYRGLSGKFEDRWRTGEMGPTARRWGRRAGTVGHVARAVVFGLIGIFVIKAPLEYDPREAIGLDGGCGSSQARRTGRTSSASPPPG